MLDAMQMAYDFKLPPFIAVKQPSGETTAA